MRARDGAAFVDSCLLRRKDQRLLGGLETAAPWGASQNPVLSAGRFG